MDLAGLTGTALRRVIPPPRAVDLFGGQIMELPGRGSTHVIDVPGPPGAPTLILLHALGCTAQLSWFPSLPALSQHFRVVAYDQRWHGRGIRAERFRLDDCADDAVAVADALGIDRFVPVGYSMGSIVAQLVWRRRPSRVSGLVLAASARNFHDSRRERTTLRLLNAGMTRANGYCRKKSDRVAELLVGCPTPLSADQLDVSKWAMREFRSTSFWAMAAAVGDIVMFDSTPWIGQVDVPTSVVVNAADRMIPTRRQRELAAAIPGARTFDVAGAGHASMVLRAETFVPVLVEACLSVSGAQNLRAG